MKWAASDELTHVDGVDVAGIFLADALEHALGAGALDPHRDAGIFRLERLGDLLGQRQVDRGVADDLAFLLRRLDQRRRDRASAGGAAASTRVENAPPTASALEPIRISRRENFEPFIVRVLHVL